MVAASNTAIQSEARSEDASFNLMNFMLPEDDLESLNNAFDHNADDDKDTDFVVKDSSSKPKKRKVVSVHLTATLDRARTSDRDAARILAAFAHDFDIGMDEAYLSRESIRRYRLQHRQKAAKAIKQNFIADHATRLFVHWDGKQFVDPDDKYSKIDRLPVSVTGLDTKQTIGVPKISRGTGEEQAKAVVTLLKEWEIADELCGMVFDTTAANTGVTNGACVLIENELGRQLLHFACRHHIYELMLKAAFEEALSYTASPDVAIFKRFQQAWKHIDSQNFVPGVEDEIVLKYVQHDIKNILDCAKRRLKVLSQ